MNVVKRSFSNIMMLMSGQMVTWVSTLVLAAAYGRYLGATGFGELYLATNFIALVGFPIEFSFNQQIVRDVARDPSAAHRYITMGLLLKAAVWILVFAVSLLLAALLGYSTEVRWLVALAGFQLLSAAVNSTLLSVQTAYMDVGMAKIGTVIEKVFDTVFALILLRSGAGVIPVGIVLVLGSVAGMLWQVARTAKMIGVHFEWAPQVAKTLIRSGMSFLAYGVLGVIYYRIDTVLLSVFATDRAIGVYGAAYRLFDTLNFIPGIVVSAVMSPILSKYAVDTDSGKLRVAIEKSTSAMLLCSLPAAAGLLITAPNIIGFIYQRGDFTGSEYVLQALAIGLIALYLNSVLTTVLVSTGQERKLPIMAGVALVFNVGLNLILIPRFMDMGAAWATSLTEALLLVIGLWLIDRALIPVNLLKTAVKIVGATLIMAVVVYALKPFNILLIIPVAGVVYVGALLALRALPPEDLATVKDLLARAMQRFIPRRASALDAGVVATELAIAGAPDPTTMGAPELEIASAEASVEAETEILAQRSGALQAVSALAADTTPDAAPAPAQRPALAGAPTLGERSPAISAPRIPTRVARVSVPLRQQASEEAIPLLQRRVQRRLAQLDAKQVVAALSQHQLGAVTLHMERVEQRRPGARAARQPLPHANNASTAKRGDGRAILIQSLGAGQRCCAGDAAATPSAPAYSLTIERRHTPNRRKDGKRRGRRSARGEADRTARPSGLLEPVIV